MVLVLPLEGEGVGGEGRGGSTRATFENIKKSKKERAPTTLYGTDSVGWVC